MLEIEHDGLCPFIAAGSVRMLYGSAHQQRKISRLRRTHKKVKVCVERERACDTVQIVVLADTDTASHTHTQPQHACMVHREL